MPRKKQEQKKRRGRPPKQKVFSVHELRARAAEGRRKAAEHRMGYQALEVEEFVDEVDRLNRKRKLTEQEILDLRTKCDLLYHEYVAQKHESEEEAMAPFVDTLRTLAIEEGAEPSSKMMSRADWNQNHGLRKDGKGLKPGPQKKKPKTIYDVPMQAANQELPDYEALEKAWMEQEIIRRQQEPKPLIGKRLRDPLTESLRKKDNSRFYY